ncbi:serine hydrolase [Massilia sp. Dwa41.01b]|uniref:serine hydrolase domain-containing protein n=1 Tax=Massilia sp. Dwa41.01b TaxID=2709302 RepID=UPI001AEF218A|nr:serine hydrolase domain-containing protein [Massilia sp. Dwa41.01b]
MLAAAPASGKRSGFARLDAELAAIAADPACELASLSVLAIRAGKPVYARAFGRRRIGGPGEADAPATPDTLYRIASVSKMMTTLGLMRLVEAGKVKLDEDVSQALGFSLRNPHFPDRPITLRQLLTHTSSLRDDAGYSFPAGTPLRDFLMPGGPLHGEGRMWANAAAPGAYFTYCNLGWGIIGTLMERVAGARFDRLMRQLLLAPLGLEAGYNPAELAPAALGNLATLYRKRTVDTEVWDANGPWIAQNRRCSSPTAPAWPRTLRPRRERDPVQPDRRPAHLGARARHRDADADERRPPWQPAHPAGGHARAHVHTRVARRWAKWRHPAWPLQGLGLGNAQFPDEPGRRLVEGFDAVGHLGDAYGLRSVFALDRERRNGLIVLVGGTSADPETQQGRYSALARFEEQILSSMFRHAIAG